jgi:uncharacterized protein YceH (UPF0502 family)
MEPLDPEEARVLGCLVEKQMTTPEYYPLTLNALTAACNQKTNRDPVVSYDETTVDRALRSLDDRGLAGLTRTGRTVKYVHRAADQLEVDDEQLAILAVLLLRGPQTPGELRARTDRYVSFDGTDEVEVRLSDLMHRDVPLVERMARLPGHKEHRYRTLLSDDLDLAERVQSPHPSDDAEQRIAALERRVAALEVRLGMASDEEMAAETPGDPEH